MPASASHGWIALALYYLHTVEPAPTRGTKASADYRAPSGLAGWVASGRTWLRVRISPSLAEGRAGLCRLSK